MPLRRVAALVQHPPQPPGGWPGPPPSLSPSPLQLAAARVCVPIYSVLCKGRGAISSLITGHTLVEPNIYMWENATLDKLPKYNCESPLPNATKRNGTLFAKKSVNWSVCQSVHWMRLRSRKALCPNQSSWWWFIFFCLWPVVCEEQCSGTNDSINVSSRSLACYLHLLWQ